MTVKEFVEDTLVQIIEGVQAAQTRIGKSGASINRFGMTLRFDHLEGRRYDPQTAEIEEMVRFDIAVTAEGGTGTKGGVGVFLGSIALGSQGQSTSKDSQISRVQFSVPIVYPSSKHNEDI
jgi:hypothetical protein